MCGLIGVVAQNAGADTARDPRALLFEMAGLADAPLEVVEERLVAVGTQVQELFAFSSFHECSTDPERAEGLRQLAEMLSTVAEVCEREQAAQPHVELQERFAAAGIKARDLAWRLARDLVPNIDKVKALCGAGGPMGRSHAFELWKLNTLFNGIDRLEVRGRDSAGIALVVCFPDAPGLEAFARRTEHAGELQERAALPDLVDRAIRTSQSQSAARDCLLFVYKVANEIGEMGENVAGLRARVARDRVLHAALEVPDVKVSVLAHTRWASNGVISEQNCHPLDNAFVTAGSSESSSPSHLILAVLNGDIDNYQALKEQVRDALDRAVPPTCTTDAKIIPMWIDRYLEQGFEFEEAFRRAVSEFQGSMAIAVQSTRHPGKVFLALRGSGQSIYIGRTAQGYLFASELYGLVEDTSCFVKMDGELERVPGDITTTGQTAVLDSGWGRQEPPALRVSFYDGTPVVPVERTAEITTRDINRAGFDHFMLKEITESVESVRKTIRGKYQRDEQGVRFKFVDEVFRPDLRRRLREGKIRRIYCVGQGTAAVAAQGIAELMETLLQDSHLEVRATKATELSGFRLRRDMRDTLVIAVSQSGTTTDTNRTVDLVRERGGVVLCIVNRRNSDLVYKSDAVFYTSDGRDVEMSVASTKAFYAQVTAGCLLALALSSLLETRSVEALQDDLAELERLPGLIEKVLERREAIRELAEEHAVRCRHWAVVGNGAGKVAADEVRIKLSELCYKAIAHDFTEDKKHIDLSSEPLILVCAAGLDESTLQDVVKEVAIFKAHKARPLVIATDGESRFDPYAEGIMHVPAGGGALAFVTTTVAGHLWGYYAARALDKQARTLRKLRAQSMSLYRGIADATGNMSPDRLFTTLRNGLAEEMREIESWLMHGRLDSGLSAATAVRLHAMFQVMKGKISMDEIMQELDESGWVGAEEVFQAYVAAVTQAVNDLTRPIDAIKHQAKTVTVGISRAVTPTGVVFEALKVLEVLARDLLPSHVDILQAISPLVDRVAGSVRYDLEGLSAAGDPDRDTRIRVVKKTGVAADLESRADSGAALMGTKSLIARERRVFIGEGSYDRRSVVLFPLIERGRLSSLMLLHVRFRDEAGVPERRHAVRHYYNRYQYLKEYVAELNLTWRDRLLSDIPVPLLFEGSPEAIAGRVRRVASAR